VDEKENVSNVEKGRKANAKQKPRAAKAWRPPGVGREWGATNRLKKGPGKRKKGGGKEEVCRPRGAEILKPGGEEKAKELHTNVFKKRDREKRTEGGVSKKEMSSLKNNGRKKEKSGGLQS